MNVEFHFRGSLIRLNLGVNHRRKGWFAGVYREGDDHLFSRLAMDQRASIALMKFLSRFARRLGVAKHVYIVGGAVRNFVIKRPIKDIDIVVDSIYLGGLDSEWFAKRLQRVIPSTLTTNQYGVAILHINDDFYLEGYNFKGEDIEIANARKESYAGGGFKPTEVEPATIHEDMRRREFSFNTLLWRLLDLANGPDKAEIIDLTGCGLRDLKEGVARCPQDPDVTFSDDPSRMIRAVKFLVKYGLKPSPDVVASIKRNKAKITNIPSNHLANLLINTFLRDKTGPKALLHMKKLGILEEIKKIAKKDKAFFNALSNWADKESSLSLFFDLMDLGLPVGKRISFLSDSQKARLRTLTKHMSPKESESFVEVLKQPGKVMDVKEMIQSRGLKGAEIRDLMGELRNEILANPSIVIGR